MLRRTPFFHPVFVDAPSQPIDTSLLMSTSLSSSLPCLLFLSPCLAFIDHYGLALAHIRVIPEPGGQYVGHVTSASGTVCYLVKCILKYLDDNDVGINELEAIGIDGTVANKENGSPV
ncbi:hypothetical protein AVEN_3238-1 [Araneus ventricosus]|uniref:Uncharacterized protein n=1 Tax=Araneus ventricosus TaxID=182803 RepID=A0A4Y2GAB4_ARAVE|nr:hypothetical protein AVEN_3238-1 [Araneus ventricosus]